MVNKDIKKIAYKKYQLDWMRNHNYSLDSLIMELDKWIESQVDTSLISEFDAWALDRGFDGTLWVCFNEFLDCEYQDEDYMKSLLNEEEFNRYKKEMEVK